MPEVIQMLPNQENAQWETVPYGWEAAIRALGHSYALRKLDAEGNVLEERAKTPKPIAPRPAVSATRQNPNVSFELWYQESGNTENGDVKEIERNAFLGGWFARQTAR